MLSSISQERPADSFSKMAEFSGNLTNAGISSRNFACNYLSNIFLRGKGWAWETAEKKQSNMN